MDRSDKCDISKTHINSNCRKLDTNDVKGKILNKINHVYLKKTLSLMSAIYSKIMLTNFSKIWLSYIGQ